MLEIGPLTVRKLRPRNLCAGSGPVDDDAVAAAIDGIDDRVALVGERPVAVAELWRSVLASAAGGRFRSAILVHPSWWPQRRVAFVVDVAAVVSEDVRAVTRQEFLGSAGVVEVGGDVVAACSGAEVAVRDRSDAAGVAGVVAGWGCAEVSLDAPRDLPGVVRTAAVVREALAAHGITPRDADVTAQAGMAVPPEPLVAARLPDPRRRGRRYAAAAGLLIAGLFVVRAQGKELPAEGQGPDARTPAEVLVEGRVAVVVPAGWPVRRITGGPGSRRIQVDSPQVPDVALHITQTYAPESTLADAAAILGRAVAAATPGVFVDFTPVDQVGGRPAVTYREVREGRVVRWSVVLDGSTRISIGCQSAPGRQDTVRNVCDEAVRSARESLGTESSGIASK